MAPRFLPPPDAALFYVGSVMHMRMKPKAHRFTYSVFALLVDLDRLEVEMRVDGATVGKGTGAAVIGGPHGSLLWLANLLRRRGGQKAGEYVSTGTCTGLVKAPAGAAVVALYAGKPRVSFRFV